MGIDKSPKLVSAAILKLIKAEEKIKRRNKIKNVFRKIFGIIEKKEKPAKLRYFVDFHELGSKEFFEKNAE